jgi:hypothetical protein
MMLIQYLPGYGSIAGAKPIDAVLDVALAWREIMNVGGSS